MLSRKVICAILVLNELYSSRLNESTGRRMLRRTALAGRCSTDSRTFRRVVQQLSLSKHIEILTTSIILTCNPAEVTIYELFVALHGGIPLGEEIEAEQKVNSYAERKYPEIAAFEADVANALRKYFERKTVTSVINEVPPLSPRLLKPRQLKKQNTDNE